MASAPLLDRDFLEKLERLTIHWQKSFAGLVGGHNRSRYPGAGQEFLDHRNFHQGDDLRAVNWRAYMRLEKLFLKMFQVEPRVPVRNDHVHEAVRVDVHEENSRMVVRRGQAEVRGLDGIQGLVRCDESAGRGFLEKMRHGALENGGTVHGERRAQLPSGVRGGFGGFSAKEGEIKDGQSRHALGRILARPALQSKLDAQGYVRKGFPLKVDDSNGRSAASAA